MRDMNDASGKADTTFSFELTDHVPVVETVYGACGSVPTG